MQLTDDLHTEAPAAGIWAGSVEWDRRAVRHLPQREAAQELERTFPERLARRVEAFQAHQDGRPAKGHVLEVRRMLVGIAVRSAHDSGQRQLSSSSNGGAGMPCMLIQRASRKA